MCLLPGMNFREEVLRIEPMRKSLLAVEKKKGFRIELRVKPAAVVLAWHARVLHPMHNAKTFSDNHSHRLSISDHSCCATLSPCT